MTLTMNLDRYSERVSAYQNEVIRHSIQKLEPQWDTHTRFLFL